METIVLTTKNDQLTRGGTTKIVRYAEGMGASLSFLDAVDLVDPRRPTTYEDIAQFVIDALNDEVPPGVYYSLTADGNVKRDDERENPDQF